jgi:hypothetical protein
MGQEVKSESEKGIYGRNGDDPFPIKGWNEKREEKKPHN